MVYLKKYDIPSGPVNTIFTVNVRRFGIVKTVGLGMTFYVQEDDIQPVEPRRFMLIGEGKAFPGAVNVIGLIVVGGKPFHLIELVD